MLVNAVLDYAVELRLLTTNPIKGLKVTAPKVHGQIDLRTAVNHTQARRLLAAVEQVKTNGPRLVAFFALIYYAGLRPEEATNLRRRNVTLPELGARQQWGELTLEAASTNAGAAWTDSGAAREERALKQRPDGQTRSVPIAPPLVAILRNHLAEFPDGPNGGLLFYGARYRRPLDAGVYRRTWAAARRSAFSQSEYDSPLARRPYDLRHACVSTWLAAGVPAPDVAAWAGHSVDVLLRVYARCIDGQRDTVLHRIELALDGDAE
jgi:integrase